MSDWAPKRFWTKATAVPAADGFTVKLDDRAVRTPAKTALIVPTQALAAALAAEWDAQEDRVDPGSMPFTRMANSAIDKVAVQRPAVVGMLAEYGGSDLLCYRAAHPEGLSARQAAAWDPWLTWSANALDAPLIATTGVMPVAQPAASQANLHARLDRFDAFELAAVHDFVAITGSLVLGLAMAEGKLTAADAWALSRIDEDWQIAEWGEDEEATALAARKAADLASAESFHTLCLT